MEGSLWLFSEKLPHVTDIAVSQWLAYPVVLLLIAVCFLTILLNIDDPHLCFPTEQTALCCDGSSLTETARRTQGIVFVSCTCTLIAAVTIVNFDSQ
jgi:hypothetical protein